MTYTQNKQFFYFLVEGKTEYNYIVRLNKFFNNNNYNILIECYNFQGVRHLECKETQQKIKQKIKEERKVEVYVLLDNDVFTRKEDSKETIENNIKKLAKGKRQLHFLYTNQKFEDFLIMHLDDVTFNKWLEICQAKNYFNTPPTGDENVKWINKDKIFKQEYKKGEIPDEIVIDKNVISNTLKMRNNKNQFHSDFINFLVELFNKNIFV